MTVPSGTEAPPFTFYNLLPETEYEFQVFATNQLGRGPGSDIVRAKTESKYTFGRHFVSLQITLKVLFIPEFAISSPDKSHS